MAKVRKTKTQDEHDATSGELLDWRELIGFVVEQEKLRQLHRAARLPQVLLFEGREGIGKRRMMAWLAALVHCESQTACGECGPCRSVMSRQHDEILWLESESQYKLNDALAIQEHLSLQAVGFSGLATPAQRIVVMPDIEKMSDRVANRLLKTFEEPGAHALILLSTGRSRQILSTILSRSVRWHLAPPPVTETLVWLKQRLQQENGADIAWSEASLLHILKQKGLSPGESFKAALLQLSGGEANLERALFALLREPSAAELIRCARDLAKEQGRNVIDLANHFELLLNRYYKWCLGFGEEQDRELFQGLSSPPSLQRVQQWRTLLRRVRLVAGRGKVPLNAQLMIEALGLPDLLS
ncbi:MAG: hypothetical protein ACOH5I_16685 [Oligoflexus sp.]